MSTIRLYNTLTKKVEDFKPISNKHINVFVCGPTVYDFIILDMRKMRPNLTLLLST